MILDPLTSLSTGYLILIIHKIFSGLEDAYKVKRAFWQSTYMLGPTLYYYTIEYYMQGFQLYIEIRDADDRQNYRHIYELVDIIPLNLNSTVTQSLQQNYRGIYNIVTMNLTITVFCEVNFGGSDCTQCVPGFIGPNCNETDHCFGVNCSGNGECNMDGMGTIHCICDPGFTGELCKTNIDNCVGVDCSGSGRCVDGVNSFTCECTAGFSGPLCSEVTHTHIVYIRLKLVS